MLFLQGKFLQTFPLCIQSAEEIKEKIALNKVDSFSKKC